MYCLSFWGGKKNNYYRNLIHEQQSIILKIQCFLKAWLRVHFVPIMYLILILHGLIVLLTKYLIQATPEEFPHFNRWS